MSGAHLGPATNFTFSLRVLRRTNPFLAFDNRRTAQKTIRPTILLLLNIVVAAVTCLPSRCLTTVWGFVQYVIEMSSGVMTCIPSFIKSCLGIQKLVRGYTHSQQGDLITIAFIFSKRNVGYKLMLVSRHRPQGTEIRKYTGPSFTIHMDGCLNDLCWR
jgi:hypothetical protein